MANDANDPQNCGYGVVCDRLKDDALALAPVQGVCPNGWHLLSLAEWETLFESVDGWKNSGTFLKSNFGWVDDGNGNNQYGFSAVAAGSRNAQGRFFTGGCESDFWSVTQNESEDYHGRYAYYVFMTCYADYAFLQGSDRVKSNAMSVRCLED